MAEDLEKYPRSKWFGWGNVMRFALVLAVLVAFGLFWKSYQADQVAHQKVSMIAKNNYDAVERRLSEVQAQLNTVQQNVVQLMRFSNGTEQHALNQIAYLLNLAHLQLMVNSDYNSAMQLLMEAQSRLVLLNDAHFSALNELLLKDIAILKKNTQLNMVSLIGDMDKLSADMSNASMLPNQKDLSKTQRKTQEHMLFQDAHAHSWYQRLVCRLSLIRNLVVVHYNDPKLKPLFNSEQQVLIKTLLQSKVLMAEHAAMEHNQQLYQQQLAVILGWVKNYYFDSMDKQHLLIHIRKLQAVDVSAQVVDINTSLKLLAQLSASPPYSSTASLGTAI